MSQSAVEFTGHQRMHVALSVNDLEHSKHFYQVLFGILPSKEKEDYVKFELGGFHSRIRLVE